MAHAMERIKDLDRLMFSVELRRVYITHPNPNGEIRNIEVKNRRAVVNAESGSVLGVVNKGYRLITNERAVELGKQCWTELFGANEVANIKIFQVDAPSTASYCHIDLVHANYVMNLWGEELQSDVYIPYIRVTNSYNTSRALRFDVGFCREVCFNGVIFGAQTVRFKFSHVSNEFENGISFKDGNVKVQELFDRFAEYARRLRNYRILKEDCLRLIVSLFKIKYESDIVFWR